MEVDEIDKTICLHCGKTGHSEDVCRRRNKRNESKRRMADLRQRRRVVAVVAVVKVIRSIAAALRSTRMHQHCQIRQRISSRNKPKRSNLTSKDHIQGRTAGIQGSSVIVVDRKDT